MDTTSGGVVTNYTVDGEPTAQVTSVAGLGDTYKQLFWSSPPLAVGNQYVFILRKIEFED